MIAKNQNKIIAGFTLLELVAIIIITGILCSFGIVKYVDFTKEAKKSTEDSIVGAIRSGITLYYVKNNSYPQELDMAANGMASNANPFFSNILSSPVTKEWKKTGLSYLSPLENNYIYDPVTGKFDSGSSEDPPEYPLWKADTPYMDGDFVIYDGKVFKAWHWTETQPGVLGNPWQEITDEWRNFNKYDGGDQIIYDGKVFLARNWTHNEQPGLVSSAWQEITDEWRDFNVYNAGDQVKYGGKTFEARSYSQNQQPGLIASPWKEITDEWRDFNIYVAGDIVVYNGKRYKAKWWTQNNQPGSSVVWELIG